MNMISDIVLPLVDLEEAGYYLAKIKKAVKEAVEELLRKKGSEKEIVFLRICRKCCLNGYRSYEYGLTWIATLTEGYESGSVGLFQEKGAYSGQFATIKVSVVGFLGKKEMEKEFKIGAYAFSD